MALLLGIKEGFCWALEFVETSVLVLCVSPKIWFKILGLFSLPIFQLSAGLFLLICMASLASLETCFLSWSMILNWDILTLGWFRIVQCWNIALVDEVLCSLTLLSRYLFDSPM